MLHDAGRERAQGSLTCWVSVISLFSKPFAPQPMFLLLYAALEAISLEDIGLHASSSPHGSLPRAPRHEPWLQKSSQRPRSSLNQPIQVKLKLLGGKSDLNPDRFPKTVQRRWKRERAAGDGGGGTTLLMGAVDDAHLNGLQT